MDANGIFAYSYDDTGVRGQLATTEVVAAAGAGGETGIDFDEILRRCYDPATASLRVVFV